MKIAQLSVLAALAFATTHSAFAQGPDTRSSGSSSSSPSSSPSGSQAGGSATDASAVTNVGSAFASDTTIADTTTTSASDAVPGAEMANTGGEPQLMLLAGVLLASGGLLLRRKMGAQSV